MLLHWSPRSPFVRKVRIVLFEAGLAETVQLQRSVATRTAPNAVLMKDNPLGKLPTLVLADGRAIYDSRVICDYLLAAPGAPPLLPQAYEARFDALRRQALGDGLLDTILLWRQEQIRPPGLQSPAMMDDFALRADHALNALEADADRFAALDFDLGHIAIGCALSCLDFRFADRDWRPGRGTLAAWQTTFEARPSAQATRLYDA
jgi:glutathione S-transferase